MFLERCFVNYDPNNVRGHRLLIVDAHDVMSWDMAATTCHFRLGKESPARPREILRGTVNGNRGSIQ